MQYLYSVWRAAWQRQSLIKNEVWKPFSERNKIIFRKARARLSMEMTGEDKEWGSTGSELHLHCAWVGQAQRETSSCPRYQHHHLVKSVVSALWNASVCAPLVALCTQNRDCHAQWNWGWSTGQVKPRCALRLRFHLGSSQAGAVILL